jgi:predicted lipoprotein with Yx(FWY)xxD motif
MRRSLGTRVVVSALLVVACAALATAGSAALRPTVKVVRTSALGRVLVTSSGLTLYHYTDEKRGKIACNGACARFWPPLLVTAGMKPTAGPGVAASKLGTIKRPDGGLQVTYNGLALYRYAPDRKAGDVKGQGVEREWYVISSSGKIVTRPATAPAPTSPPPVSPSPPPPPPPPPPYYP